ncbi:hypothetical protein PG994_014529 [Apiospora phragmitis]|uniref:Uncharacterized protein n=1 Tax=Apiospora phragmitis TaxID=2905665 RepID=A0ABR1T4K4_9PEZI
MAQEPPTGTDPGQPGSHHRDNNDDPGLRADSPNDLSSIHSDRDSNSDSESESSSFESASPSLRPASAPVSSGTASGAASGAAPGAAPSWCQPICRRNGVPCYVDERLEDPATLERHIRYFAATPPVERLEIRGSHTRTYTIWASGYVNGQYQTRQQTNTEKVTDFCVKIDMSPYLYSQDQNRSS